jgi:AraC family transcriptional regulator, transcriptional activator of pobA
MHVKTEPIPVCNLKDFDALNKPFWFGQLNGITDTFRFLERPHKQYFYTLLFVEKAEGWMMCFTEDFFSLRYNNNVLYQFSFLKKTAEDYARLSEHETERWKSMMTMMQEEIDLQQKGHEKVIRSFLNILLFDLDRKFAEKAAEEKPSLRDEKVMRFEKLVEQHYTTHKNPSWYAEQLNITPNYLNRLCHLSRNITAGELIRKRVLMEAQRLLYYTPLSVSEIAFRMGFETASYFNTFFKKLTDQTPEQFRKQNFCA